MPDPRPLIVSDSADQLEDLLRLAAAGCTEPDVATDAVAARSYWQTAPLVVLGERAAAQCVAARLPHRAGVVVIGQEAADSAVWAIATELAADHVVFLPAAEPWLVDRFADCAGDSGRCATVVAVAGGRGGAGASVLSAALSVIAACRGLDTLLLDGDPLGGGLDVLLGGEERAGLRWPQLAGASGRMPAQELLRALPRVGGPAVLSWDRGEYREPTAPAMQAVVESAARGSDLIVADLPRRVDDAVACVLQRADCLLLVVPAEVRACASTARVAAAMGAHCTAIQLVVRGPAPSRLRAAEISSALGLPLAGTLRAEPGLAAALERGEPPGRNGGPLAGFCARFLDRLEADSTVTA